MNKKLVCLKIAVLFMLLSALFFGRGAKSVFAQTSSDPSVLYVPLIGITSVPKPLALPQGPGEVIYNYAVKNFLWQLPLANVQVSDDHCNPVKFIGGDDNNDGKLDVSETWRYRCSAKLTTTTQSAATAMASLNGITATHKAFATVTVGSNIVPPLVSIVNTGIETSPAAPSAVGSRVTFTYKVNNPGAVPLSDVAVSDSLCGNIPGKLGDTNSNNFLDIDEVWIYSCTVSLSQTTTNTAVVKAFAGGQEAVDSTSVNVKISAPITQPPQNLFDVEISPATETPSNLKIEIWEILSAILVGLTVIFLSTRKASLMKQ